MEKRLNDLINLALDSGANDANLIAPALIPIEDEIIDLCRTPLCPSYGKSANCPPHALAPAEARRIIENSQQALIFKLDVAPHILLSDSKDAEFRKIYEIAATVENYARKSVELPETEIRIRYPAEFWWDWFYLEDTKEPEASALPRGTTVAVCSTFWRSMSGITTMMPAKNQKGSIIRTIMKVLAPRECTISPTRPAKLRPSPTKSSTRC